MKFEAITIKDIAKALHLSVSTVSKALRGSHEISEETKQTVMAYARANNYKPNPIAQSLKRGQSRSIGVIVCNIDNNFFSRSSTVSSPSPEARATTSSLPRAVKATRMRSPTVNTSPPGVWTVLSSPFPPKQAMSTTSSNYIKRACLWCSSTGSQMKYPPTG